MASSSVGKSSFSRLPQIRAAASQTTISACRAASLKSRRPGRGLVRVFGVPPLSTPSRVLAMMAGQDYQLFQDASSILTVCPS